MQVVYNTKRTLSGNQSIMKTPSLLKQHLTETATFIKAKSNGATPSVLVVLGSGLGTLHENPELTITHTIAYSDIPHFPQKPNHTAVVGHAGELVFATLKSAPHLSIVLMRGRIHYYEGFTPQEVVYPLQALKLLGVQTVLLSNAAGGIQAGLTPGDLLWINDQLNLTGLNPLIGENPAFLGSRFFDMTEPFCPQLRQQAFEIAESEGFTLFEGVYAGLTGPSYETKAEIKMLQTLGASAVGMSTVLEVLAARHMGLQVGAVSCISNLAAGLQTETLSHAEVMATTSNANVMARFQAIIIGLLQYLAKQS
jgi:purine-nucleoside phosphorylase